ncbi:hypothetical protein QR680_014373 [Steinernema hermaphroditum]|uniref:Uncharacterized protein n=1 Tax=Steinernema hermaphroditum TaxID=289476 RepID=A0AA39IB91_9BILA|nr:hypothetical protein QR680_014373 [Steinernema hermaphroditum]
MPETPNACNVMKAYFKASFCKISEIGTPGEHCDEKVFDAVNRFCQNPYDNDMATRKYRVDGLALEKVSDRKG